MVTTLAAFGLLDWSILGLYLAVVVCIGLWAARGQQGEQSYFLGNRAMPGWAVGMSLLATVLSATTFIGVPQSAYAGNLTYFTLNIGGVLGALLVAWLFIPAFYKAGTLTIYGYLGQRFGTPAMIAAASVFLLGRLLGSGARLFMAGIAFALIYYGDTDLPHLLPAIAIFGIVGTLYTMAGGIRAVIWTDTLQIVIVVGAALLSIYLLMNAIPLSLGEMVHVWRTAVPETNKLQWLDASTSPAVEFTIWTALALTLLNAAAYGTDQDLAQRLLTCKSAKRGSAALVIAVLAGVPVTALFMFIGLLLFIFYQQPEIMGAAAPADAMDDTRGVYPQYLLHHMPTGLAGLAMAGLFAAAMSTLDSTTNAMASSFVADIYKPWRKWVGRSTDGADVLRHSRLTVAVMGMLLTGFAALAAVIQTWGDTTLLVSFALAIMSYAYSGLLGVFLTALLTRRGNTASVMAALAAGALTVLLLNNLKTMSGWVLKEPIVLAWPWWMVIAVPVSFAVCAAGSPRPVR